MRIPYEHIAVEVEMNKWYLEVRKLIRDIRSKALDVQSLLASEDKSAADAVKGYLKADHERLQILWNEQYEGYVPSYLGRHISFGMANDFEDILRRDLTELEDRIDALLAATVEHIGDEGFLHLLHPVVVASSFEHFQNGHLREAVLNSVVAIFDLIRERTGIDADGSNLVNKALSLNDPYLVLSEVDTDSGQNDQKGFLQMFNGSYQGIRNPKAHSLNHDLTEVKAAQYLVHASFLARRVSEAQLIKSDRPQIAARVAAKTAVKSVPSRS